jgi:hypothetical protein
MSHPAVRQAFDDLRRALGFTSPCGSITLNVNDDTLQSVKTETYQRILPAPEPRKVLDRRGACSP